MSPPKPHKANWTHTQAQKRSKVKAKGPTRGANTLSNVCRKMVSYGEICKGGAEGEPVPFDYLHLFDVPAKKKDRKETCLTSRREHHAVSEPCDHYH